MSGVLGHGIHGDDMQLVEIELDPGEGVRAEAGAMMFMQPGIEMQTSTGGGIFKGCERMVTGESFFLTNFIYQRGGARWRSEHPTPDKVIPLNLRALNREFICQRDSFLLRCPRR